MISRWADKQQSLDYKHVDRDDMEDETNSLCKHGQP
jgi:hypothetical protein